MKPNYPTTTTSDDDSDGEEEVLQTWQVTKTGAILVVPDKPESPVQAPEPNPIDTNTQVSPAPLSVRRVSESSASVSTEVTKTPQQAPQLLQGSISQASATPSTQTPTTAPLHSPQALQPSWYLGGIQVIKLLTSVDGDFDENVLARIATVSSVVAELALSVESLVSDDNTVGGFEEDLLAKIAENTLASKRAANSELLRQKQLQQSSPSQPTVAATVPSALSVTPPPVTATFVTTRTATPVTTHYTPSYEPVPNPLARVTPPASPVTTISVEATTGKRKAQSSATPDMPTRKAKISRCESVSAPMIQAM